MPLFVVLSPGSTLTTVCATGSLNRSVRIVLPGNPPYQNAVQQEPGICGASPADTIDEIGDERDKTR
jgi:hypothetical protein